MKRSGFFNRTSAVQNGNQVPALSFINIGGEQFHALAVSLIDDLKNTSRPDEKLLKKLLDRFFINYPKFKQQQAYLTPAERMGMLLNSVRISDLVECLAVVLRQLVADEIEQNFLDLKYREVFDGLEATTPKDFLRLPTTEISPRALGHSIEALGMNISIFVTEHDKGLRERQRFINTDNSSNANKTHLAVQVHDGQYFPGVKNKADFAYVGQLAINPPESAEFSVDETGTIADKLNLIEIDSKRYLQSYNQWRQNLLTMVAGNELTTSKLMDLYIEFLPEEKENTNWLTKLSIEFSSGSNLTELLANALAALISTNKVEADQLFDRAEARASAAPAA